MPKFCSQCKFLIDEPPSLCSNCGAWHFPAPPQTSQRHNDGSGIAFCWQFASPLKDKLNASGQNSYECLSHIEDALKWIAARRADPELSSLLTQITEAKQFVKFESYSDPYPMSWYKETKNDPVYWEWLGVACMEKIAQHEQWIQNHPDNRHAVQWLEKRKELISRCVRNEEGQWVAKPPRKRRFGIF